jgi:hypothetical protein
MPLQIAPVALHPPGEVLAPRAAAARAVLSPPLTVDTLGRRFHVEWDPQAPVTPLALHVACLAVERLKAPRGECLFLFGRGPHIRAFALARDAKLDVRIRPLAGWQRRASDFGFWFQWKQRPARR